MPFATVSPPSNRPACGTGRRRVTALAAVALVHGVLAAAVWGPGAGGRPAPEPAAPLGQLVMVTLPALAAAPAVPAPSPLRALPPPKSAGDRDLRDGGLSSPITRTPAATAHMAAADKPPQALPVMAAASPGPVSAPLHTAGVAGPSGEKAASAASAPTLTAAGVSHAARALPGNALPPYPEAAREDGLEGLVRLAVEVDAQGRVSAVRWDARSGVMLLDIAARDAVRLWRFEPARQDGQAVASTVRVALQFRLDAPVRWVAQADTR
jgi:protein TonB